MAIFAGKFQRTIFIVSSGRTGTKALAHHLDKCYPNVCAMHEPSPSWRLRRASARYLCGRATPDEMADLLYRSRKRLVARITRPVYIESNPFLGGFLEAFAKVFERPKVLHVVRDPRTYIRSTLNWGSFRGLKNLAATFVPYWLPKPEHRASPEKPWAAMSEVERLAWYWKILNTELNRGQELYGDNYLRITFESLFARDGSGLREFCSWAELEWKDDLLASANSEKVNASSVQACPKWDHWPTQWRDDLMRHCRDLMAQYGYSVAPETSIAVGSAGIS